MICKKCGAKMYERKAKNTINSSTVYICSNCDAVVFIWPDGDVKEGTNFEPARKAPGSQK